MEKKIHKITKRAYFQYFCLKNWAAKECCITYTTDLRKYYMEN